MKKPPVLYQFNIFVLLLCIALVTSCLEMGEVEFKAPDQLLGKWYLVRVEKQMEKSYPPTDSVQVWLEFALSGGSPEQQASAAVSVRGENLVNIYAGSAIFNGAEKAGNITISSLGTTKRGGPAQHMAFDDHYLRLLEKTVCFSAKDDTLRLQSDTQETLVFIR